MASSGYWQERWKQRQEASSKPVAATNAVSESPLGLGLVIVGAAALAISTFLPLVQAVSALRMVENNTLIQHDGWIFIALAFGIAASGYRASRGKSGQGWIPIVLCVVAAVLVLVNANDKGMRTLYPVQPDGTVDTSQPGLVTSLGIAIYVAGAGIAAAFIGSVMLLQSAKHAPAPSVSPRGKSATKRCPDCAETILADAKVCKHCGYRFAPIATGTAQPKPTTPAPRPGPGPLTNTRGLKRGDRVQVVIPGDEHEGKVGKVKTVLSTGYIAVGFGLRERPFRPDQLKSLDSPKN